MIGKRRAEDGLKGANMGSKMGANNQKKEGSKYDMKTRSEKKEGSRVWQSKVPGLGGPP